MDRNNDDEINRALTGEGRVSLLDKWFIGLDKMCIMMEKGSSVLQDVIHAFKIAGLEDSRVMEVMEQAESTLNVAIFFLKLLEKHDSTVVKVIILLIILMIPVLHYFM